MSCLKIFFIITKLVLIFSAFTAFAKDPNKIVAATVNDYIITAQDVLIAVEKLPSNIKEKSLPKLYPNIVNELINQHLITKQAYKEKLDLNKNVISKINKNKDQIIARYWLEKFLKNQTKRENIEIFYNNYIKSFESFKEFNANHILVKDKKEALEILAKLKKNSNFSDLAKKYSIGPSGKNEGKLGWFRKGQMVKTFEDATFALKKGEVTPSPVKTQFGYHIIKLNNIRDSKPKKLSEIKPNIIKMIKKNSLSNLEKKLRKNQKIVINNFEDVAKKVND